MAFQSRHVPQEDIHPDALTGAFWVLAGWLVTVGVLALVLWGLP